MIFMEYAKRLLKEHTGYDGHLLGKVYLNFGVLGMAWLALLMICLDKRNGLFIFMAASFVFSLLLIIVNEIIPGAEIMWNYIYYKKHYENMSADLNKLFENKRINYYEEYATGHILEYEYTNETDPHT